MGKYILAAAVVGLLIYFFLKDNQFTSRGKLLNKALAKRDAQVVSVEPKVVGSRSNRHYVTVVTFSDGTSYQDKSSKMKTGYMKYTITYDKEEGLKVLEMAKKAHEEAVRENESAS